MDGDAETSCADERKMIGLDGKVEVFSTERGNEISISTEALRQAVQKTWEKCQQTVWHRKQHRRHQMLHRRLSCSPSVFN